MALQFQQTDSAPSCAIAPYSSGLSLTGGTTAAQAAQVSGTPGSASQSAGPKGGEASPVVVLGFECSVPAGATWSSGTWTVRLNVNTANANDTWDAVYLCRVDSTCGAVSLLGSATGLGISLGTTGVKTATVGQSSSVTPNSGDQVYVLLACSTSQAHGGAQTFGYVADQLIDSPYTTATTVTGSATADAVLKSTVSASATADAILEASVSGSLTADAILAASVSGSFAAEAELYAGSAPLQLEDSNGYLWAVTWTGTGLLSVRGFSGTAPACNLLDATGATAWVVGIDPSTGEITTTSIAVGDYPRARALASGLLLEVDSTGALLVEHGFTCDAALAAAASSVTGTFSADAVMEKAVLSSATADAVLKKQLSGSLTADAILQAVHIGGASADAVLQKTIVATATADATLKKTVFSSAAADAVLHKSVSGSVSADAILNASVSGLIPADAVLLRSNSASFSADAVLLAGKAGSVTADSVLKKSVSASFTADASLVSVQGVSGSFTADAIIERIGITGAFTADAALAAQSQSKSGSFTADAVLKSGAFGSFSADSVLLAQKTADLTADAVLLRHISGSFSANAALLANKTSAFSADAVLGKQVVLSATVDAILRRSGIVGSFTADAVLSVFSVRTGSFTADAVLQHSLASYHRQQHTPNSSLWRNWISTGLVTSRDPEERFWK